MPELQIQRHDDLLTITLNTHTSTVPWSEISLPHKQMWSQIYQDAAAYGQRLFAHITHNDALRAALLALRPT
ncbi:MAG TPA: hypothetical protein VL485_13755, partial [Ktedonobacteraceae bacterium]|nr:hypothetical protein [Ktedonobacteraceae bacterium]